MSLFLQVNGEALSGDLKPSSFGNIVDETLKALRRNRSDAVYVRSREEALQIILQRVPSNTTIGAGDSLTLKKLACSWNWKGEALLCFGHLVIMLRKKREEKLHRRPW